MGRWFLLHSARDAARHELSDVSQPANEESELVRTTARRLMVRRLVVHRGRKERRRAKRRPFDERIELWRRDHRGRATRTPVWALNISSGGVRIISSGPLQRGERVGVQLSRDKAATPARVAWVKRRQDGCIAGLSFTV